MQRGVVKLAFEQVRRDHLAHVRELDWLRLGDQRDRLQLVPLIDSTEVNGTWKPTP
jgi:hypothetical protein